MLTAKTFTPKQIKAQSVQREETKRTIEDVICRVHKADLLFCDSARYLPVLGSDVLCLHIDHQAKRISYDQLVLEVEKIEAKARETNRELRVKFDEKFMSAIAPLKNKIPSLYSELEEMVRSASSRFNEPSRGACGDEASEYSSDLEHALCERLHKERGTLKRRNKPAHQNSPIGNGWHEI